MSKAFTKETDEEEELPDAEAALPAGQKNYMTPLGHRRLADELWELTRVERPKIVEIVSWAAGNGDRSENGDYIYGKKRLREIDRRVRFLMKRLEIAEIVDQELQRDRERVYFGATVTYADGGGVERTIRIVGVDETSFHANAVSWVSPIARALHRAEEGDIVKLRTPTGVEEIEVIEIAYVEPGRT